MPPERLRFAPEITQAYLGKSKASEMLLIVLVPTPSCRRFRMGIVFSVSLFLSLSLSISLSVSLSLCVSEALSLTQLVTLVISSNNPNLGLLYRGSSPLRVQTPET